ncbi:hypothetical protein ACSQ67_022252 [Phaseolus vulgaris]
MSWKFVCVAFFYCEIDGSSLCLQCDMIVHVGGKRTHERYLLLRQRAEFPGDKPAQMEELGLQPLDQNEFRRDEGQSLKLKTRDSQQNHSILPVPRQENNIDGHRKMDKKLIDLNTRPLRLNGPTPNNQGLYANALVEVKTYYGFFIKIPKGERIGEELYDDDGVVVLVSPLHLLLSQRAVSSPPNHPPPAALHGPTDRRILILSATIHGLPENRPLGFNRKPMASALVNRVGSVRNCPLLRSPLNFMKALSTSSSDSTSSAQNPKKSKRRKKKNLFEVAQFLPNWGIGYHLAKSHWHEVSYEITKLNLYKVLLFRSSTFFLMEGMEKHGVLLIKMVSVISRSDFDFWILCLSILCAAESIEGTDSFAALLFFNESVG